MNSSTLNDTDGKQDVIRPLVAYQKAELQRLWELFQPEKNQLFEIRAIDPFSVMPPQVVHFRADTYDCLASRQGAFEERALELNQAGYNVYTPLNPVIPDFCGAAAKDADILHRRLLLIDIDRMGNTKQSATKDAVIRTSEANPVFPVFAVFRFVRPVGTLKRLGGIYGWVFWTFRPFSE